jgi:hypothetical protein
VKTIKHAYRVQRNFHGATKQLLDKILRTVETYQSQGYTLSLRQLYYQLVVQNVFSNELKNYAKLSELLGEARMTGLCDWDVIEDRIRVPRFPNEWENINDAMNTLIEVYRRKRWSDQENYVEVWVEKDALSGVLEPITRTFHVHLLVNRGYSSISAMHEAALRFRDAECEGKTCYLLYFGDHDPSGEDMVHDIKNRLSEFQANVTVLKVALTHEQVDQYALPPNPAKTTDPRARGYIEQHGDSSWELDALPPATLNELLTDALDTLTEKEKYAAQKSHEETDKNIMRSFAQKTLEAVLP